VGHPRHGGRLSFSQRRRRYLVVFDREFIGRCGLHLYQLAINARRDGDALGIALGGAGG